MKKRGVIALFSVTLLVIIVIMMGISKKRVHINLSLSYKDEGSSEMKKNLKASINSKQSSGDGFFTKEYLLQPQGNRSLKECIELTMSCKPVDKQVLAIIHRDVLHGGDDSLTIAVKSPTRDVYSIADWSISTRYPFCKHPFYVSKLKRVSSGGYHFLFINIRNESGTGGIENVYAISSKNHMCELPSCSDVSLAHTLSQMEDEEYIKAGISEDLHEYQRSIDIENLTFRTEVQLNGDFPAGFIEGNLRIEDGSTYLDQEGIYYPSFKLVPSNLRSKLHGYFSK